MHKDNIFVVDPTLPHDYNIALYVLEELCAKGIIDIFELAEAVNLLRKKYDLPTINIYGKKDNNPSN